MTTTDFPAKDLTPEFDHLYNDDEATADHGDAKVIPKIGDKFLSAEIMLPRGSSMAMGCVTGWKRDIDGNPIGCANANPILNTRSYIVEFSGGEQIELTVNMIAELLYAQCDPDGNQYVLLEDINDHRKTNSAVMLCDQKVVRAEGRTYLKQTTIGWQLCCQWKDGSTLWENLADLKELHPIETAEYAKVLGIDHEPVFNWWVPHVLKKRDRIISLVKNRNACYLKLTHKFGIKVPKTTKEALEIDKKNGNTLWSNAIPKEMKDVQVAFRILPDGELAPIGYQKIPCHMVLMLKWKTFNKRRDFLLVAIGPRPQLPSYMPALFHVRRFAWH